MFIYFLCTETTRPPRSNENGLLNTRWVHGREQAYIVSYRQYDFIQSIYKAMVISRIPWRSGWLGRWDGDLCVCHGIWASLTCIGANSVPVSRKLACFREDSTDFELSVRGHFTDSCETKLFKMLVINILWYFSFGDSLWNSMKIQ